MKILSLDFAENNFIPRKFTCDGENINPNLKIEGVVENTKGLVLIMDDPDAPSGTFVHWLMWNISPQMTKILENQLPAGVMQGTNSGGKVSYMGPCPASGAHHYVFKLYALDNTLDLPPESKKADLESAMQGHIIESAQLIGLYERQ